MMPEGIAVAPNGDVLFSERNGNVSHAHVCVSTCYVALGGLNLDSAMQALVQFSTYVNLTRASPFHLSLLLSSPIR